MRDGWVALIGESEFYLDLIFIFMGSHELGFGFDAEAAGVMKELVDGLVADFAVEELADAGLGLGEDDLEFFLRIFFGELQDGLIELGFEF